MGFECLKISSIKIVGGKLKNIRKSNLGFTLIELMIVVALIAVMGMLIAPEFKSFKPNIALNGATREFYGGLQGCKLAALRYNTNCVVAFNQLDNGDTYSYFIFVDDNKDFTFDPPGEKELGKLIMNDKYPGVEFDNDDGGDGLTFLKNTDGVHMIAFLPNGLPSAPTGGSPNGDIFLKNSQNKKRKVVLTQAGNLSISDVP